MVNLAFYHLAAKQSLKGQGFDGVWMLVHHRLRREFANRPSLMWLELPPSSFNGRP